MTNKKVALITGSSGMIGASIAKLFIDSGYLVVGLDKTKQCESTLINNVSYKHEIIDLRSDEYLSKLITDLNRVDVLVNNAAVPSSSRLHELDRNEWDNVLDVNLNSYYKLSKYVVEKHIKTKESHQTSIVNVSSIDGVARNNNIAYATSKSAVIRMTEVIAMSYGKYNIRANCIIPGFVDTEMLHSNYTEDEIDNLKNRIPVRRISKPIEIAKLVRFLCSNDASYINGASIKIDGGYLL